ncbi:LysR family transcriptional regulator [Aliagarivorans taiwanensis]|uniref:LysR family transcriptional regulator n=1 Tax=Aliagarivorans taiwanensis TaxID=561966 RepID=UPI000401D83F|nr:LysR family transcriptional regulator [Aliagarivorans taiwanensis]
MSKPLLANQAQLTALRLVAEHGSPPQASRYSNSSAAEIEGQLQDLQALIGAELFVVRDGHYHLSPCGLGLIEQAQLIELLYQQSLQQVEHALSNTPQQLQLGYAAWFPSPLLTLVLRQLSQRYPHLQVAVSHNPLCDVFFSFSAQPPNSDPPWHSSLWQSLKLVKVAQPQLVKPQRFDGHMCLFDIANPRDIHCLFDGEGLLLDALQAGLGWAVLPEISVESRLADGTLKAWPQSMGELPCYRHCAYSCPPELSSWLNGLKMSPC